MIDPLADLCDPLLKAGADKLIATPETELKQVKSYSNYAKNQDNHQKKFLKIFNIFVDKMRLRVYNKDS